MTNSDFWASIDGIIADGFTDDGLKKLDDYAEQFISEKIVYQRFSPSEQHGCSEGGPTHVIASLLAAATIRPDCLTAPIGSFKREQQCAATQAQRIEAWARKTQCWIDRTDEVLSQQFGQ